jgi:tRNA(fMet)-specific endonuclease VapC
MTLHVLDTDTLTLYQLGHAAVVEHVHGYSPDQLATTIISVEEVLTGWYTKVRRSKNKEQLARAYQHLTDAIHFLSQLQVLSFTEPAIDRYEELRTTHRRHGKNDLRIAAIVLASNAILVTRNVRDFQEIEGLVIADWTK